MGPPGRLTHVGLVMHTAGRARGAQDQNQMTRCFAPPAREGKEQAAAGIPRRTIAVKST